MSQNGYSQYENEITDIPTVVLKKLSNYYNVSIDYILCLTDKKDKYYPSNIVNITNNMNRLSEIRNDLDLKQIEVSKKLPISRPTYSTYETCYCDIPIKILKYLVQNREKIVSRDELMDYLWESESFIDDNTLTVNITRLRGKLEEFDLKELLQTRRGQGYILI